MKHILFLLIITIVFISCTKKESDNNKTVIKNTKKEILKKGHEVKKEVLKKGHEAKKELSKKIKEVKKEGLFKAPDFDLATTTGDRVKLSDYKGKILLIDFWGSWCPPCRKMIPTLSSFVNKCSAKGVVLIGMHSSFRNPGAEKIDMLAGEMGVNYPMALGQSEVEAAYGVKAWPSLFLIGKDGMVKHRFVGYHSLDEIRKYVKIEMDKN